MPKHRCFSHIVPRWTILTLCALGGSILSAQNQLPLDQRLNALEAATKAAQLSADNAWMLISAALVLMMTGPGLALFYGGLVRNKNVLSTMMHSFALMAVVTVLWAVYGYSLTFAPGTPFYGDLRYVFLSGVGTSPNPSYGAMVPQQTYMIFELMFAIITPALISGAFAERIKFSAMLLFTVLWSTLVYFPLAHMIWGQGGFLNAFLGGSVPCLDFAGGTVVEIGSGVSALVCALYVGKRIGFPREPMKPHNLVLSFTGGCLLWVGWFGFNAGSAINASALATSAFVATQFAAAAAALGWLFAEWVRQGKPSMLGGVSGAVAGMVAITPAAGFVRPFPALLIGFLAGIFCFYMVTVTKRRFGYDDTLDVFGIHGGGGTLGMILTGVFATNAVNNGLRNHAGKALPLGLADGNGHQVFNQLIGVVIAWGLSAAGTYIVLKIVDALIGVRALPEHEIEGLDVHMHGEEAYNLEG